jgi:ELWxxDGT repeat protein
MAVDAKLLIDTNGILEQGSDPADFTSAGLVTFFTATTGSLGRELWKTDGTMNGTILVKDVYPGVSSGDPRNLFVVNGTLFFTADDGLSGRELWKSDGTGPGTVRVKDITPGAMGSTFGSIGSSQGVLYVSVNDGVLGEELWRSDGTEAGTWPIMDISPNSGSSTPRFLNEFGGLLYFVATDSSGQSIWRTDGTATGTEKFTVPVMGVGGGSANLLTKSGNRMYFTDFTYEFGSELWATDGTAAGTAMIADIEPGATGASINQLIDVNGTLYFTARTTNHGRELWMSQGSQSTTRMVRDINAGASSSDPKSLTSADGGLYFTTVGSFNTRTLWKTDGSSIGTQSIVSASLMDNLVYGNGTLFFTASDSQGIELWSSTGTAGSTGRLADIFQGNVGSSPGGLMFSNNRLLFRANDGTRGFELWKSDGTVPGTVLLRDIRSGTRSGNIQEATLVGENLYYLGDDSFNNGTLRRLGNDAGTMYLFPNMAASSLQWLTNVNGNLYFKFDTTNFRSELWMIPSGSTTPIQVKSFPKVLNGLSNFTAFGGMLFFTNDSKLWRSDGTTEGTIPLGDVSIAYYQPGDTFRKPVSFQGMLYFSGATGADGYELWRTDGLVVERVKEIAPGNTSSDPQELTVAGNTLYFRAFTENERIELWKSDGTEQGTVMVRDIGLDESLPSVIHLEAFGDALYFSANDGAYGYELWTTDGTFSGTKMVKDIYPGFDSGGPVGLISVQGALYFVANDPTSGRELWKTDGTEVGTVRVADIVPGIVGSNIRDLLEFDGRLVFAANDRIHGEELWIVDGEIQGAVLFSDISKGPGGSQPSAQFWAGERLYLVASNEFYGQELFYLDALPFNAPTGIELSNNWVSEDQPPHTFIGDLNAIDPDLNESFTFSLVDGALDNALFSIQGNQLFVEQTLDFESKSTYMIRVRVVDRFGFEYEDDKTIFVNDILEHVFVYGTPGDDRIDVRYTGTGTENSWSVTVNRVVVFNGTLSNPNDLVYVYGQGGNDSLQVYGNDLPDTLYAQDAFISVNGFGVIVAEPVVSVRVLGSGGDDLFSTFGGFVGIFDGGLGADTLLGEDRSNYWDVFGANRGFVNGLFEFRSIESLVGGGQDDWFSFQGIGRTSGVIDGGVDNEFPDLIDYSFRSTSVTVNLELGTASGTGGIVGIDQVIGSSLMNDRIIGWNRSVHWDLYGSQGLPNFINNDEFVFQGIESVIGGNSDDTFRIAQFTGFQSLVGGQGSDYLDFDPFNMSSYDIDLRNRSLPGIADSFSQIEILNGRNSVNVFGSDLGSRFLFGTNGEMKVSGITILNPNTIYGGIGIDSVTGPNLDSTWQIGAEGLVSLTNAVSYHYFWGVENFTGGSMNDEFKILLNTTPFVPLAGNLNGGGGTNTVNYETWNESVSVNLQSTLPGNATGISGILSRMSVVLGGSASDTLIGNLSAPSVLIGNAGNDLLQGGSGFDVLIGGTGMDTLIEGSGQGILVGGSTIFDNDIDAILLLLAEWRTSTRAFAERVSNLRGESSSGLNSGVFLNEETIQDDGETDSFTGNGGSDWFWANLNEDLLVDFVSAGAAKDQFR